jgi:hypothetical protein
MCEQVNDNIFVSISQCNGFDFVLNAKKKEIVNYNKYIHSLKIVVYACCRSNKN